MSRVFRNTRHEEKVSKGIFSADDIHKLCGKWGGRSIEVCCLFCGRLFDSRLSRTGPFMPTGYVEHWVYTRFFWDVERFTVFNGAPRLSPLCYACRGAWRDYRNKKCPIFPNVDHKCDWRHGDRWLDQLFEHDHQNVVNEFVVDWFVFLIGTRPWNKCGRFAVYSAGDKKIRGDALIENVVNLKRGKT